MTFQDIEKANSAIRTTNIKGKEYAEVNQRIKAFRMICPAGSIQTELLSDADGVCVFRAVVTDENGNILGTGTAYEKESSSYINKTSYIENCETSAVGRALGMAGFGIDTSVASAEEVTNAINNQEQPSVACARCGNVIESTKKRNGEPWLASEIVAYTTRRYGKPVCKDCCKIVEKEMNGGEKS